VICSLDQPEPMPLARCASEEQRSRPVRLDRLESVESPERAYQPHNLEPTASTAPTDVQSAGVQQEWPSLTEPPLPSIKKPPPLPGKRKHLVLPFEVSQTSGAGSRNGCGLPYSRHRKCASATGNVTAGGRSTCPEFRYQIVSSQLPGAAIACTPIGS